MKYPETTESGFRTGGEVGDDFPVCLLERSEGRLGFEPWAGEGINPADIPI